MLDVVFRDLPRTDLHRLQQVVEAIDLAPQAFLFRAGDPGDAFFVIETGKLEVLVNEDGGAPTVLATLGPGELVGEMALLYGNARSASVRAVSAARLLKVRADAVVAASGENATLRARLVEAARQRVPSLHLAAIPMFAGLDGTALRELDLESNWIRVQSGEALFREGDPPDHLYVVVRGRLEVTVAREDGGTELIGQLGPGSVVGEGAVLSGEPRTATVRTIRDSELVRLSRADLERFLRRHPAGALEMLRELARRVRPVPATAPHQLLSSIALVPASDHPYVRTWLHDFAQTLSAVGGPALLVDPSTISDDFRGPVSVLEDELDLGRLQSWLHAQESRYRYLLLTTDSGRSAWTSFCLRHADLILLVACADDEPRPSDLHEELFTGGTGRSVAVELTLLHAAGTARPAGTARWLRLFPVSRHHHVRVDRRQDTARVARFLAGKAVSVAFSGGGARALGQIGVVKALLEAGVPIDAAAGVSAGCFAPAFHAMGYDHDATMAVSHESVGRYNALQEATLPIVSFLSGRRSVEMLRRMFDVDIEDLWFPFCCISTNLTRASLVVHDRGPLWKAVRASTSVPGVAPPVCEGGELLVDGGVLNNLPADVLRRRFGGTVIALDVSLAVDLETDAGDLLELSGWRLAWKRFNPLARETALPHVLEILMRTAMLSSIHHRASILKSADFYMRLPVHGVPTFDWKAGPALVERCYEFARSEIARWNLQYPEQT